MLADSIYFAGGCFWGVEKYFSLVKGVIKTAVGYANGITENPTYEEVCEGNTGYAETVEVVYDSNEVSLEELLSLFFKAIDPTTLNRQGLDVGTQYRSGIYYTEPKDLPTIVASLDELQSQIDEPVVVEVAPLGAFYPAEDYHQEYLNKNPGGYCHINPQIFAELAQD